ncbi:aminotransferase class V-fold PLP-dependent enzyme [Gimesia aquarii]|uniref:Putative cysteine desulfurase n=1 Tax=Gimesia aquarii TaxID=2527964 RepID=A0A517VTH4_9PLAN|nr:aminotransferase class V-fold PLP-dependent enzyme [Gimesia aquarii]QDT96308.1 putative cysteine desulfurase [Gimesia aquarii]
MLDQQIRDHDFPSLKGRVYLNTAAEGIPPIAVSEAFQQYFQDKELGMDGRELHEVQWEAAKKVVSQLYGMSSDEVSICSCSSEAFNLAYQSLQLKPGDEVIISDLDFPASYTFGLQQSCPATVKIWEARDWELRLEDLQSLLTDKTRVVSISLVSFFNGFKIPLKEVIQTIRQHSSALIALDVTQALGRIPLDLEDIDLVISSTHKWILASHGGGLVGVPASRANEWTVPAGGWFNLKDAFGDRRFEKAESLPGAASFTVGMPNYPAVYAIRAALDYITAVGLEEINQATEPLVEACLAGLAELPVEFISPRKIENLAGIIAFRHPEAERIYQHLHSKQIHPMYHAGRIRVALHGYNTLDDVETFLRELKYTLSKSFVGT